MDDSPSSPKNNQPGTKFKVLSGFPPAKVADQLLTSEDIESAARSVWAFENSYQDLSSMQLKMVVAGLSALKVDASIGSGLQWKQQQGSSNATIKPFTTGPKPTKANK